MGSVLEDLECTICLDFAISPIQNCTNGHIVCGICFERVKVCGICQANLAQSPFAERLAKWHDIKLLCRNSGAGCSKMVHSFEMKKHVSSECEYRRISCFLLGKNDCQENSIKLHDLYHHLTTVHKTVTFPDETTGEFSVSTSTSSQLLIKKFDGNTFFRCITLKDDVIFQWACVIGDEEVAQRYRFGIKWIRKKSSPSSENVDMEFQWNLPVTPIHKGTFGEVQRIGRAASVHQTAFVVLKEAKDPLDGTIYKYSWTQELEIIRAEEESNYFGDTFSHKGRLSFKNTKQLINFKIIFCVIVLAVVLCLSCDLGWESVANGMPINERS